jgi:hypothetical protein
MQSKLHSDNVKVRTGVLPILGLNAFLPSEDEVKKSFKKAIASIYNKIQNIHNLEGEHYPGNWGNDDKSTSLVRLSIPFFEFTSNWTPSRYEEKRNTNNMHVKVLYGPFMWNGMLFETGAEFEFQEISSTKVSEYTTKNPIHELVIMTPEKVYPCRLMKGEIELMHYDTYNANALSEISSEVIKELGLDLPDDLEEFDGDNSMITAKYLSVYVPELTPETTGIVMPYVYDFTTEEDIDTDIGLYDELTVEFIDNRQPFAYVAIEIGDCEDDNCDKYGMQWDGDRKKLFESLDFLKNWDRVFAAMYRVNEYPDYYDAPEKEPCECIGSCDSCGCIDEE